jgi:membrane associated rhomboid family serine protease
MSNYFSPSHSLFPSSNRIGLGSSRFYSSYDAANARITSNINVLYGLMGLNVAVFGYMAYAKAEARAGHPSRFIAYMRNWSCNYTDVVKNGKYWQLMTSTFAHADLFHLGSNMFTAYYLGQFLCYMPSINPARLLTIALGSGVAGSVGFLYQRYLVTGGNSVDYNRGLGFSGALMGITSVAACLSPTTKFSIYGIIPVPLWGLALGYAFFDGYYLNDNTSRVGHAGHLGGLAFGLAYYLLKLRGLKF